MSGTKFCLASLVAAVVGLGTVRGQGTMYAPTGPSSGPEVLPPPVPATVAPGPSRWVLYDRQPGCCGPVGGHGPINFELYLRNGIAFPVAHSGLGGVLEDGWTIEGGGRTLLLNAGEDEAWTVDLGVGNTFNGVEDRNTQFINGNTRTANELFNNNGLITTGPRLVTAAHLNRTYLFLSGGHEWYLWGSAEPDAGCRNWRVGADVGGRYGTEKLNVNETRHMTDNTESVFVSVHSDVEIPWGQVLLQAGVRLEYSHTWSDIFHSPSNGDVQDVSLLFMLGMRF
jgi:hypothetical protein